MLWKEVKRIPTSNFLITLHFWRAKCKLLKHKPQCLCILIFEFPELVFGYSIISIMKRLQIAWILIVIYLLVSFGLYK